MPNSLSRRRFIQSAVGAAGGLAAVTAGAGTLLTTPLDRQARAEAIANISARPINVQSGAKTDPFIYCLNMSTIRGQIQSQKLDLAKQCDIAIQAGYKGIEPWMNHVHQYKEAGGSLKDLGRKLNDAGVTVESAIGFAKWIVDDDAVRAKGLEDAKRDMDAIAQLGGTHIAAPPVGAHKGGDKLDLFKAAERYSDLLKVGDQTGVIPMVEVWGFSKNLSRLGESVFVMVESGHPKACLLPDVYHVFKGGSPFEGLAQLSPDAIPVFHMNDYPGNPPRTEMNDSHRVYPGDGIAPLTKILAPLTKGAKPIALSLELFNRDYWKQDPLKVAKTGLAKMKAAVAKVIV